MTIISDSDVYQSVPRFFCDFSTLIENFPQEMIIQDDFVVQHLRTVLRIKAGAAVVVVDAQREVVYNAVVEKISKQDITLLLQSRLSIDSASPSISAPIILAVALIKEQRWDWLLQKATELGVRAIQPLLTERCVIRLSEKDIPKKQHRWGLIARSAAEQSEGLFIPTILPPLTTDAWIKELAMTTIAPTPSGSAAASDLITQPFKLLAQERGKSRSSLKEVLAEFQWDRPVIMTIGPEGGWSASELTAFHEAGFIPVSLGERVLRSETAALMAMSAFLMDLA